MGRMVPSAPATEVDRRVSRGRELEQQAPPLGPAAKVSHPLLWWLSQVSQVFPALHPVTPSIPTVHGYHRHQITSPHYPRMVLRVLFGGFK